MPRKNIRTEIEEKNLKVASRGIAVKIIQRLGDLNMKQNEFAKLMGVNQAETCRWTNGRCNFTILTLTKIEAKLEIKLINYE